MKYNTVHRGMALITLVLSLLVLSVLVVIVLSVYKGGSTENSEPVTGPIDRGKAIQCLSQIRRVEIAVQMYRAEKGVFPDDLSEIMGMSEDEFYCPVTHVRYVYDPGSGTVTCPDHPR